MRRRAAEVGARNGLARPVPSSGSVQPPQPERPRVVVFVTAVFTVPIGCGIALLVRGEQLPAAGPVLVLALLAALAVNRSVFFPSEQAATAEVAIVLAAVTGFASTAVWLGPLAVALLLGPLDMSHWERRSFVRMAYNAGNRGAAGVTATATFVAVGNRAGVGVAAVTAALAFVVVDLAVSTALLVVQGTPVRVAIPRVATIDRFALPLALSGAAIGFLVDALGWWAVALALAPLAFVPEQLILRRARAQGTGPLRLVVGIVAAGAIVCGALWLLLPSSALASSAALLTVGAVLGVELDVDAYGRPSPLVALVVVVAAIALPGDYAYVVAPLAALVACATTWWCRASRPTTGRVAATCVIAVAVSSGAVVVASTARAPFGPILGPLVAVILVTLAAVALSTRPATPIVTLGWCAPFLGAAAAVAGVWRAFGPPSAAVLVCWLGTTAVVARSFGATPWRGRVTTLAGSRILGTGHRVALVVAASFVALLAALSIVATTRDVRTTAAWLAVAVAESMSAIDLAAIRQWRLAPLARMRTILLTAASAVVAVVAGGALADGRGWWSLVLVVCAATLVAAGWRPACCADAVATIVRGDRCR